MRSISILLLSIICPSLSSATVEGRTTIYELKSRGQRAIGSSRKTFNQNFKRLKTKKNPSPKGSQALRVRKRSIRKHEWERHSSVEGNLKDLVVLTDEGSTLSLIKLFVGDEIELEITKDMIGYGDSVRPVTAVIRSKSLKNWKALGNVSMDQKTKELIVLFTKIRGPNGQKLHTLKAEVRLKGRHETKFWTYFWATVGANIAGGFAESSKETEQTILGSKALVTPENMLKGGIAQGTKAGAGIFLDELKNYPEFTVVIGPTIAKAVVSEKPILIK